MVQARLPRAVSRALRGGLALALAPALALPATVLAQDAAEDAAELDRIEVTGSLIRRTEIEGPTPVVVIEREEFEQQGYRTVQEVLEGLVQNTGGGINQQFVFGFTPGASAVNLRAFGSGRSLTLIDGRRLPIYPLSIGGTSNFVDLASIPTAIIERIEVLTDGASAIYGSDAVSGVINIITRKEFDGIETRVRYGDTFDGGYQVEEGEVSMGASGERTRSLLSLQYAANEQLMSNQREYAESDIANPRGRYSAFGSNIVEILDDGSIVVTPDPNCGTAGDSLGGLGIAPGTPGTAPLLGQGACSFDRTAYRQLFPENTRYSLYGRVDHDLNEDVTLFATARYYNADTYTQIEPFAYSSTALFGGGSNNPTVPNNGGLFVGPNGGIAGYVRRLVEFGPRASDIQSDAFSVLFGAQGRIGYDWDWELGVGYNELSVLSKRSNLILSAFESEIENGLDLFQPIPQDVVDRLSYIAITDGDASNRTLDFRINGDLGWELGGGNVQVAGLFDWENQRFSDVRDPITLRGDSADGGSSGIGERDHFGIAGEMLFPLTDSFNLDVAVRYDRYDDDSDVGGAFSPRLAFEWRPIDDLLVRGSAGRSFRAPDMQRLFGATTRAFSSVVDTPLCVANGGSGRGDPSVPACVNQVQSVRILAGSNVNLEEEKGKNFNLGVVWNVTDALSVSADAYQIELENIVAALGAQTILDQCASNGLFCDFITRDAQGTLLGGEISTQAQNLSFQQIRGVDLTAQYLLDTSDWGSFNFTAQGAWVESLETQLAAGFPVVENIDFATLPEWRWNFDVNWSYNDFGATVRTSWIGEMPGLFSSTPVADDEYIDDYLTVNAQVRYDFGERIGELRLGINNLFDEEPAEDPTNNNWPWFVNAGGYSVVQGREWYLEWTKRW